MQSNFRSIAQDDCTLFKPSDSLEEFIKQFNHIKKQKQQILLADNNSFEITAKTMTGRILTIQVRPKDTVLDIKKEIYKQHEVPLDQQQITFNDKQLNDTQTVYDCGIYEGACIHLILKLSGGMFHESSRRNHLGIKGKQLLQKGLSMIRYMRSNYSNDERMDNLHGKLIQCSTEKELNDMVQLIEQYYLE